MKFEGRVGWGAGKIVSQRVGGYSDGPQYADANIEIYSTTNNTDVHCATFDYQGNTKFNSGYGSVATAYGCRAWINFNGSVFGIRASGNVSSITDNGTGDYTVHFSTAMPDTSYCTQGSIIGSENRDSSVVCSFPGVPNVAPPSTSAVRFNVRYAPSNSAVDSDLVSIAVFR